MLMESLLALTLITVGDDPKVPEKGAEALKGKWELLLVMDGDFPLNQANVFLTIGSGKITWTKLPYFSKEKGESKLTVDSSKSPPTVEFKIGNDIHKALYRFQTSEDRKSEYLELLLAKPGKAAPKGFGDPGLLFRSRRMDN